MMSLDDLAMTSGSKQDKHGLAMRVGRQSYSIETFKSMEFERICGYKDTAENKNVNFIKKYYIWPKEN